MFTSIFNVMQQGQALSLHLMRKGEKLVVCFQPLASDASDAAGSNLTPLVVTGTPAELEEGFMAAICSPLQERFGMLANLEEFKQSTQKAQPKAPAKTAEAGTLSVEPASNAAPAKKSKREEQVEAAEKMAKSGNLPGAYGIYKKLYEQDKADTKAGNRMHELWAQMSQKTMFPRSSRHGRH
jgi:PRTRC genetic system protein E